MAFYSNCTLPSHIVSYVEPNNVRSTLDILWSSLGALIGCTYTVLHLNVPKQRTGKSPSLWPSIKWSIVTLVAPELILVKATGDYSHARTQLRKLHKSTPETKTSWTLTHMLFAEMGGFVLEYPNEASSMDPADESESSELSEGADESTEKHQSTLEQDDRLESKDADDGRSSQSPGAAAETSTEVEISGRQSLDQAEVSKPDQGELGLPSADSNENVGTTQTEVFHLTAATLRTAIEEGLLSADGVDIEEIWGRSRSTLFPKLLSMGQVLYFLVDCLVRLGRHLPLTPLEVGVIGFVCCSAITYLFTLPKPKDVSLCITLKRFETELPQAITDLPAACEDAFDQPGGPVPNDHGITERYVMSLFSTSILLGAIHLGGWNLTYPSEVDAWLWRSAALITTVVFAIYFFVALLMAWLEGRWLGEKGLHSTNVATGVLVASLYAAARLVLIVEMFRCLHHLPPEAYATTWTTSVPHIG